MPRSPGSAAPSTPAPTGDRILPLAAVLVLAVFAVYANTLSAPFVFDDIPAIEENLTIRDLGNLRAVFSPPADGSSATNRPLVNLTLALNHAAGGMNPFGYRLTNVALHALATLALFGLVRRTCLSPLLRLRFGSVAPSVAFGTALLWAVHPLQTETVICVIQRTEGLVGLFYLLACYGFVRAAEEPAPGEVQTGATARAGWMALTVASGLLGVASKEVIATVPVLLLLYDRTFVAGTFREAWRRRRRLHLTLAATWLPLAWLILSGGRRGGTVGFGLGMSVWEYALTQCEALVRYLGLSVWPHPLVLDYGGSLAGGLGEVWLQAVLLLALLGATAVALRCRPAAGFLGAWFFVILAPSSSFIPLTTQTMAEHRMYLPLAAIVVAVVGGLWLRLRRGAGAVVLALAVGLGALSMRRNADYHSALAIWTDTVAKQPLNPRARDNLSVQLSLAGRISEALFHGKVALAFVPTDPMAHLNFGNTCARAGLVEEAKTEYETALRLKPGYADAHYNLGNLFAGTGRMAEALAQFEAAVRFNPRHLGARVNLGNVLESMGRLGEAIGQFEAALRLAPDNPEAHYNFGNALLESGRLPEAAAHYGEALRLRPTYEKARTNLDRVRALLGRTGAAPGVP